MFVRDRDEWVKLLGAEVFINRREEFGYWRASRRQNGAVLLRDEVPTLLCIAPIVGEASTFVDCGANVGLFTAAMLPLKRVYPELFFYAYEPNPDTFKRLSETLKGKPVISENVALSNKDGFLEMATGATSGVFGVPGGHFQIQEHGIEVPCRTLESCKLNGSRLFLKIDVEGHELEVLQGAQELFETERVYAVLIDGARLEQECLRFLERYQFVLLNVPYLEGYKTGDFRILALKGSRQVPANKSRALHPASGDEMRGDGTGPADRTVNPDKRTQKISARPVSIGVELGPRSRVTPSYKLIGAGQALRRLAREASQIRRFAGDRVLFRYLVAMARNSRTICRTGRLTEADAYMSLRPMYRAWVKGVDVVIPGKVFGLARELYGRMPYFAGPGLGIKFGDVVVDLGANCGLFSMLAAKLGATVFAVEAQYGFIKEIEGSALVNGVQDRIRTEWGIVGAKTGVLSDCERIKETSHWLGQTPPVLQLTDLFEKWKLSEVDFLKIDIEGSEFDLMANDPCFLKRVRKIAMEIHLDYGNWRELRESLVHSGFETLVLSNDLVPVDELFGRSAYLMAWQGTARDGSGWDGFADGKLTRPYGARDGL